MKMGAVALSIWFAQALTLCALHENLLTTQELDSSMTTAVESKTNQYVETKTAETTMTTTTTSEEELLSDLMSPLSHKPELSDLTSSVEDERNKTISTSHQNITSLTENIAYTNTASVETEYRETRTSTESTSIHPQATSQISTYGTSSQLHHDVQTTTSSSWTEDRTSDNHEANASTLLLVYSTSGTDVTLTNGSYDTTDHQSPALTTTPLEILSTSQTHPNDITNSNTPTGTSGSITLTATPFHSTELTSSSTENTEEPLVSNTKMMDWTTQENTEALTTSQTNIYDTTNTTWRDYAGSAVTKENWSTTNTTTSTNISISSRETPQWTNCFNTDSFPQSRRVSKLACFITMWSLGMVASIFLGLTVFLWVRLSVTRRRARLRERGWGDRKAKGTAVKEKVSLWAESCSSTNEIVEFWYANGDTVQEDKKRHRAKQVRMRKDGQRPVGTEEDMWIQPKVTLNDITEFWYANRRVRHNEETPCELHEE